MCRSRKRRELGAVLDHGGADRRTSAYCLGMSRSFVVIVVNVMVTVATVLQSPAMPFNVSPFANQWPLCFWTEANSKVFVYIQAFVFGTIELSKHGTLESRTHPLRFICRAKFDCSGVWCMNRTIYWRQYLSYWYLNSSILLPDIGIHFNYPDERRPLPSESIRTTQLISVRSWKLIYASQRNDFHESVLAHITISQPKRWLSTGKSVRRTQGNHVRSGARHRKQQ